MCHSEARAQYMILGWYYSQRSRYTLCLTCEFVKNMFLLVLWTVYQLYPYGCQISTVKKKNQEGKMSHRTY